ncbi:MAG: ABC transporter ATP-binding protein [Caldisericaceae bacterium]
MLLIRDLSVNLVNFKIENVSFEVFDKEIIALLGDNGSGKTTLLNAIAGFVELTSGSIIFDGVPISKETPNKRNIGYIFQDFALFPHMTVEENIKYGLRFKKIENKELHFKNLVEFLKIGHLLKRFPTNLSGGEKQKVAIARSLILDPKLILFDEPTSQLSPTEKERIALEIKDIVKKFKKSAIYVTHNIEEANIVGDRIAIIENGKLLEIGKPIDIFYKPTNGSIARISETNVIDAIVKESANDFYIAYASSVPFAILGDYKIFDKVKIFIRPEEIALSKEKIKTSAQNSFEGKIKKIIQKGVLVKVRVSIKDEVELDALITRKSFEEMELKEGEAVFLYCKITSIHSFKEEL